jgi:hypothetical protein
MRCLTITMNNPKTLEGKELFEEIFKALKLNEEFNKFGNSKIIILSAILESAQEHNLHSNILIDNNTTFEDYYNEISNELDRYNNIEYGYGNESILRFVVKVWNCDHKGKTLIFKDSYLLLPLSLRKLCLAFNIASPKGYFPFKLANIVYTGVLPKFDYWTGISLGTYKLLKAEYHNKFWNFKDEAIKYCKLDCKTLHEIIIKFNELIFNHFSINAHSALTLPALAMRIYKTHFMPENTIYQLLGKAEYNIRESYTGGAVDVYIPHNRITAFFSKN